MKSSIRDTLNVIENGVCGNLLDTDIPLKPSSSTTTTTSVSQSSQNEVKEDIQQSSIVRPNSSDVSKESKEVSLKDLLGPSVVDELSKNSDVQEEVGKRCKQLEETSKSYLLEYEKSLPNYTPSEVFIGDLLGKGGYASVYEIKSIHLCDDNDDDNDEDQRKSRHYLKARVDSHNDDDNRKNFCYAIKFLRKDVMKHKELYQLAAVDIALEAKLLCSLFHPNIIQLRGFCTDKLDGSSYHHHSLILDRLYETLDQRIVKWKQEEMNNNKHNKGLQWNLFSVDDVDIPRYKLNILFDITSALQYIHEMNIVYRDIKPTNFGFDAEGIMKLFDFGLAKDLSSSEKLKDGTYHLTRAIGSQRYMAPEVYKGEPYNTTADSYSFSIMLWEILTMKKPYQGFNNEQHAKLVFYGTYRPDITTATTNAIPKSFQSMLESGWSSDLHKRPNFETIQNHISDLLSSAARDDQPPINTFNFESLIMKAFAVIIAAIAVIIFDSSNIPFM